MEQISHGIESVKKMLSEHGIRATIHRIQMAHYLLFEADHPTADDVLVWAIKNLPKVSRATVYNTLREFSQAGLIREFQFPQISKTVYDRNTEHHYHFYDRDSETILDLNKESVKVDLQLPSSFQVNAIDILVTGNRSN